MIVGDLKPLEEIVASIKGYNRVLVIGCGSCVTVCLSGGEREAEKQAGDDVPAIAAQVSGAHHGENTEPEEQADPPGIELDTSPADDSLESAAAAEAQPTGIGAEQVIANNQSKED